MVWHTKFGASPRSFNRRLTRPVLAVAPLLSEYVITQRYARMGARTACAIQPDAAVTLIVAVPSDRYCSALCIKCLVSARKIGVFNVGNVAISALKGGAIAAAE